MLNSNQSSKKRKITDFHQFSSQQPPKQFALSSLQNNSNNNHIDLTTPPAFNTRSALKRSHSDNASEPSNESQNNSKTETPSKSSSDNSPNKLNSNNSKMDVKNLIDLINEEHTASKKQPSHGATNEKGLLCPVCSKVISTATNEASLNLHIDECLSMKLLEEENTVPKTQPGPSKVETLPAMNAIQLNEEFLQQWEKSLIQPVKKPLRQDYIVHHDDEDSEEHSWEDEEESYSQYQEEDEEQLDKVRCPYHGCGAGYIATEEFGKHVLQNHKGGYQKHLCPLCAPTTGYSVHKGTNLYRHVQQFHAFFLNASPETTTNKPHAKPQNIEFVEEILMKDLDSECCICFEQFETGNTVARLPCLCIFHKTCVVRWFEKEKRCPVHEEIPQS